ncbi:MAG TPA: sugar kinase [Dehalococcoidia bacterium]|nr:sugar kinase [Dehalococcoidia bacterium]
MSSNGFNAVHFVTVRPDGDREFVYYRAGSSPSTIKPEELNPEYISNAKIMHCSGIAQAISPSSRATVLAAAQIAHLNGVPVSYDPNYRHQLWNPSEAREAMEELMPYVDIFLPSAPADSKVLFETEDPEKVIQESNRRGVETVVVTLGEDGALIGAENEVIQLDPMPAGPVIDTTGAGDSFKGGFIHGFLEGKSIAESALIGNVCAGITITGRGALNPMPYRKKVYDKVRNLR